MRAAFYECDITPPLGCYLFGQGVPLYATDVQDRLYAKALVVEDEGKYAAIVCADVTCQNDELHDFVTARVQEYTGIPGENVCVCVNHTHWGAPVKGDSIGERDEAYVDVFNRLVADAVILAYKRLEDASATFGVGKLEGISFNRNHILKDGRVITWGQRRDDLEGFFGTKDDDVCVMTFYAGEKPLGAIVNFSCHQACLPSAPAFSAYTGDFSSILSKELKKIYGEDFVSVFVTGPQGDINHIDPFLKTKYDGEHYRIMGRKLAAEAQKTIADAKPIRGRGVEARKETIALPRRPLNEEIFRKCAEQYLNGYNSVLRLNNLVTYYAKPKSEQVDLTLQVLRIGGVHIYTMPGEPYSRFGLDVKAGDASEGCMVIALANGHTGYIPTPDCWAPNCDIYEASFSEGTYLIPEAGDRMVERLLEMAEKLDQ